MVRTGPTTRPRCRREAPPKGVFAMKASRNLAVAAGVAAVISGPGRRAARPGATDSGEDDRRTCDQRVLARCEREPGQARRLHPVRQHASDAATSQNVPSDLEQMPAQRRIAGQTNGTLNSNDHTILISHTAGGIVSRLTYLPGPQRDQTSPTTIRWFKPDGSIDPRPPRPRSPTGPTRPTSDLDPLPNMITDGQKNTPAPWVPYTRAGCDISATQPTWSSRTPRPTRRVT